MTFNVRHQHAGTHEGDAYLWEYRKSGVYRAITDIDADILGLQEVEGSDLKRDLLAKVSSIYQVKSPDADEEDFHVAGTRNNGKAAGHLYVDPTKFTILNRGDIESPDVEQDSKVDCVSSTVFAVVSNVGGRQQKLLAASTHLANGDDCKVKREKHAQKVAERLKALAKQNTVHQLNALVPLTRPHRVRGTSGGVGARHSGGCR